MEFVSIVLFKSSCEFTDSGDDSDKRKGIEDDRENDCVDEGEEHVGGGDEQDADAVVDQPKAAARARNQFIHGHGHEHN